MPTEVYQKHFYLSKPEFWKSSDIKAWLFLVSIVKGT